VKTETHATTIDDRYYRRQNPALGKEYRKVCSCGWQAPWAHTWEQAEKQECPRADQ
jgi:hypothetical protein